ncbi:hypothetical protein R1flu_011161 [Riccia fluitans]|uniref:FAM192A/Fyv6 N-terminal domain-containing protein n=1 Tax=Riccia fluitans TaxID=41844 RepID=A0ABD1Z716_9MARC
MVEPKLRLMNFVAEKGEEIPDLGGGVRSSDGYDTRPLFEILKENKEKKDAEFNERFKHRPPKALDDDETEFLENVEMLKREQERKRREEEKQELVDFQTKILSRTIAAEEHRTINTPPQEKQEASVRAKRPAQTRVLPVAVKIKPVPKKVKTEDVTTKVARNDKLEEGSSPFITPRAEVKEVEQKTEVDASPVGLLGLASYGDDESDEDED